MPHRGAAPYFPGYRPLTREEETEVVRLQHALLKVLPKIFIHDSPWMHSSARLLAFELWRDNVRTQDEKAA